MGIRAHGEVHNHGYERHSQAQADKSWSAGCFGVHRFLLFSYSQRLLPAAISAVAPHAHHKNHTLRTGDIAAQITIHARCVTPLRRPKHALPTSRRNVRTPHCHSIFAYHSVPAGAGCRITQGIPPRWATQGYEATTCISICTGCDLCKLNDSHPLGSAPLGMRRA